MEMEAAPRRHPLFFSPQPHHLAELRIEPAHSAVAFSAPCAAAGRKRHCLLPASSPRKKMLLELPPFGSAPSPSPPPSPRQHSPATAPSSLLRGVGSPASDFSFPSALAWSGGSGGGGGGGNIFAFLENALTTPSPTGSNASAFSFLASPGHPMTPTGSTASGGVALLASPKQWTTPTVPTVSGCFSFLASPERPTTPSAGPTASGGFAFLASPKQPTTPTGPTASGGFVFMASSEQSLTPTGSTASGGFAFLSSEPPLSPKEYKVSASGAVASLPSPKPARNGPTDSGGFVFFPSPGPAFGHTGSPESPAFVFSAPPTSSSPVHKSGRGNGTKKRSRHNLRVATARRRCQRQWEQQQQQQATPPAQKVAKTGALTTGEASRSSILSGSLARPCCTFFTSPAKAGKQETKKASSEASRSSSPYVSPARSRCTFVTSPVRPSSEEKASKREREMEVSSVAREDTTSPAACTGAEVVVRVTCTCGVQKEFCIDHCH